MSGGSYNYEFLRIENLAGEIRIEGACWCAPPHLRRAFRMHLVLVAAACKAIEWNDSCDGDNKEAEKILACIGPTGDLTTATEQAEKARDELDAAILRAKAMPGVTDAPR